MKSPQLDHLIVLLLPGRQQFLQMPAILLHILFRIEIASPQIDSGLKLHVSTQNDIGSSSRHISGDGDRPSLARLGNNLCLSLVIFGVENNMLDAAALEQGRESFRFFN